MCMKNVNTDVLFFSSGNAPLETQNSDTVNLVSVSLKNPLVSASYVGESKDFLVIPSLTFLLSLNATERTNDPIWNEGETPQNTIHFDEKYELCLRLTETSSGEFVDLSKTDFTPEDNCIILCRKIYSTKTLWQFYNAKVHTPPKGKSHCVLKVLIRLAGESTWIVQSVHPIKLSFDN